MSPLMMLAGIAIKTSLVVGAVGLLTLALRRQSAAFGHVLWTMALALCVLMPLAIFVLPSHAVIALPSAATLPLPREAGEGILPPPSPSAGEGRGGGARSVRSPR